MTENRIEYSIPMKIVFEMKSGYRLLYSILGVLFTAGALVIPGDDMIITVSKVFFLLLGVFLLAFWVYVVILKKMSLNITPNGLEYTALFHTKSYKWNELGAVFLYEANNNKMIGFTLLKTLLGKKDTLKDYLKTVFGGDVAFAIPIGFLKGHEPDRLIAFFESQIEKVRQSEEFIQETANILANNPSLENTQVRKPGFGALLSFAAALVVGILYGVTIYLFDVNFLVIPFFGILAISFHVLKYIDPDKNFILWRFYLAFLCLFSVFIARITISAVYLFVDLGEPFSFVSIGALISDYFAFFGRNIQSEWVLALVGIVSAGVMFFVAAKPEGDGEKPRPFLNAAF